MTLYDIMFYIKFVSNSMSNFSQTNISAVAGKQTLSICRCSILINQDTLRSLPLTAACQWSGVTSTSLSLALCGVYEESSSETKSKI